MSPAWISREEKDPPREAQCCVCGSGSPMYEMLGVALFPMTDVDAAQQWLAHPECASVGIERGCREVD